MEVNQFAWYQLKTTPENRLIRFRCYKELQEKKIPVRHENYGQVYLGRMKNGDTPASIRKRLEEHPPRSIACHSLSVSDVLVLNSNGETTAYYVDKEGFIVIAGFLRLGSSCALISYDTTDFHIEGKEGSWLAYDSIIIDGREFFLMEHTAYGAQAANVVLDGDGNLVVDNVFHGFDEAVKQQIREYLHPEKEELSEVKQEKPALENWQKAYENGEYLRSAEITEEQNYNMIDGRMNNLPLKPRKIGERISVLDRLHLKQAESARKGGKPVPQMTAEEEMERRRK